MPWRAELNWGVQGKARAENSLTAGASFIFSCDNEFGPSHHLPALVKNLLVATVYQKVGHVSKKV